MRGSPFPKWYADRVARLRVPGGFVLVAAFAWMSRPTVESLLTGLPVAALGLALRGWAAGHLRKNMRLARSGPYAFTRNPLYVGTTLAAGGLAIASRRWEVGAVFAVVFLLVYLPVIELEEQHLRRLFPEYADYANRVPRLVPQWRKERAEGRFEWAVYAKNQEYQALLGFLAGTAWLVFRLWIRRFAG